MKVTISGEDLGGLMYIKLAQGEVVGTKEIAPGVILDYTKEGRIVGIEVLYLDKVGNREADFDLRAFVDHNEPGQRKVV